MAATEDRTEQVERPTAHGAEQEPGRDDANHVGGVHDNVEVESVVLAETGAAEEGDGVRHERVATPPLKRIDDADEQRTSSRSAAEALAVRSAGLLGLLERIGVLHKVDLVVDVRLVLAALLGLHPAE